jgi:hypothetical protein
MSYAMTQELGNFTRWPLEELQEKEKTYPSGHLLGEGMRAEIKRRQNTIDDYRATSNSIYVRLGIIVAIVAAAVAIYALVRHEWLLSIIKY